MRWFRRSRRRARRYVSVMIIPHEDAASYSMKISRRLLGVLIGLVGAFFVVLVAFMIYYGKVLVQARRATQLERRVEELTVQQEELAALRGQLRDVEAMSLRVRRLLGLPIEAADSLAVAAPEIDVAKNVPARAAAVRGAESEEAEERILLRSLPSRWPVKGWISRGFAVAEGEESPRYHPGIDIAASRNAPVVAAADGVVITSGWNETYGHYVVLDHGFGTHTLYAHNERNSVEEGDRLRRGDVLGFVGSSGRSTAPHLHFEITKNGVPVDPRAYLLNP
jgi:murein DD-endopeptidase MepM/ murein hydrolase activator NlpD